MKDRVSAAELAGLPCMPGTPQNVTARAAREQWPWWPRAGRGGGKEYAIAALPAETQSALFAKYVPVLPSAPDSPGAVPPHGATPTGAEAFNYDRASLWLVHEGKSANLKAQAQRRYDALHNALGMIVNGVPREKAMQITAQTFSVDRATLYRWYSRVLPYAREDWVAVLAPGFVGGVPTAECTGTAWEMFQADYLRDDKPTATACYERLQQAARAHGWKIPSLSTLQRRLNKLPKALVVLKREGEYALWRLYPAIERSVRDLHALEWINGDGYQHNVFVKFADGSIGRPKTWFWQDIYSRKLLTWRTDVTENTQTIRLSFGELIEKYGIPRDVTIDNTRAAANKWMTGGVPNRYRFAVKEDDPLGLFPMLGITVHWTTVIAGKGNGQAKPIERSFGVGGIGEYCDKHPALSGAYTGARVDAKPESYGSTAIPYDVFCGVLNQAVATWNALANRDTEICQKQRSFDAAFAESYARAAISKATDGQRRLWLLVAEAVKVRPDGSFVLEAGGAAGVGKNSYAADFLIDHIGKKIVVRFDPKSLHERVHVYSLDGRYLCDAECTKAVGWRDQDAAAAYHRANNDRKKATKKLDRATLTMSVAEAARYLPVAEHPQAPESKIVKPIFGKPVNDAKPADSKDEKHFEEMVTQLHKNFVKNHS